MKFRAGWARAEVSGFLYRLGNVRAERYNGQLIQDILVQLPAVVTTIGSTLPEFRMSTGTFHS